jgi:TatD DNase family protein
MTLIDAHCHIHEPTYPLDADEALHRARDAGVNKLICVGTSVASSRQAVNFAASHDNVFATIGVHPHDTKDGWQAIEPLIFSAKIAGPAAESAPDSLAITLAESGAAPLGVTHKRPIVAVGEIGLDYFYTHSPREIQIQALEWQINLALRHNLPIVFHVRDAFDDFWPILDNFHGIRGELHSFTDTTANMEQALKRGLYIGVNGISTFTKNSAQHTMFQSIELDHLLLETDAPFLTPVPYRGKVNEPAFVANIAQYHADIRGISLEKLAAATTANATALFAL